jgi:hypothetical protein
MRARITGLIALGASIAIVASGCGGTANVSADVAGGASGATIVPASAPVYVSIDTDLSSGQWQKASALLDKFPSKSQWLTQLQTSFEKSAKVSWDTDVKPALGKELDVVVLGLGKTADVIGMTQPGDAGKFDALVQKSKKLVVADYKGWKIFSDSQAKLDAFTKLADAGSPLADDAGYKSATAKLSTDALVTAYANGEQVTGALKKSFPAGTGATTARLVSGVAELVAENDGLRLDGTIRTTGIKQTVKPYTATLVHEVPAGALLFASFNGEGLAAQTSLGGQLQQGAGAIPRLGQLLPVLQQLGGLFAHESALYVLPGMLIPEVTLVTKPDSPAQAAAALDSLVAGLGASAKAKPITIGTVKAKELNLGRFSIYYGIQGGELIVTSSQQAFQELKSSGSKLSGDATYKEALAASGMPAATNGFLYVNLKDSIPLLEGLAQLGGAAIPSGVSGNLGPLRTAVAWATSSAGEGTVGVFVEIK